MPSRLHAWPPQGTPWAQRAWYVLTFVSLRWRRQWCARGHAAVCWGQRRGAAGNHHPHRWKFPRGSRKTNGSSLSGCARGAGKGLANGASHAGAMARPTQLGALLKEGGRRGGSAMMPPQRPPSSSAQCAPARRADGPCVIEVRRPIGEEEGGWVASCGSLRGGAGQGGAGRDRKKGTPCDSAAYARWRPSSLRSRWRRSGGDPTAPSEWAS